MERPQAVRTRTGRRRAALGSLAGVLLLACRRRGSAGASRPGDLDLTFSGDGKQTTDFGFGASSAAATVRQPDGKIVAVGTTLRRRPATSRSPATTRTARSTRASPATASRRPTSGRFDEATGVALQADGKIVAVGTVQPPTRTSPSPATTPTARSTRASPGTASRRPTSGASTTANGVAIQADGKIVVVGSRSRTGWRLRARPLQPQRLARHELLRRRQADDRLRGRDEANGVALQGDGKIVAVGRGGASGDFALARYNPNGSLDTSFSGDGRQTTDFGAATEASGVALQGDGKIVAVGRQRLALTATSPSPATTPTARSTRASPATASRRPTSGARLRRGAPGWRSRRTARSSRSAGGGGGDDFALARYNPNGSLDTSFSGDGKQTTDFGGATTRRAGWRSRRTARSSRSATPTAPLGSDFALARYNPERLARPELLRRRQADDRLPGLD